MRLTRTCLQWEVLLHITDVPDSGTITTLLNPKLDADAQVRHFLNWLDNPDVLRLIDLENMKLKKPYCSRLKLLACGPEGNQEGLPHQFGDLTVKSKQGESKTVPGYIGLPTLAENHKIHVANAFEDRPNVIPLQLPYSAFGARP